MNKATYAFYFFIALYLLGMAVWSLTHHVYQTKVVNEELDLCNRTNLRYYNFENGLVVPMLCDYPLAENATVWIKPSYYGMGTYQSIYSARLDMYFYCSMSVLVSGFTGLLAVQEYVATKNGEGSSLLDYKTFEVRAY